MFAIQLKSDFSTDNRNFFFSVNIRSLRFYFDEIQIELKKVWTTTESDRFNRNMADDERYRKNHKEREETTNKKS